MGLINIHIYRNLLNIYVCIYIYFMKAVVKFAVVIKEILESGKCNSIFWDPYTFKCLQLVKYCFKRDFELILYYVCMNK